MEWFRGLVRTQSQDTTETPRSRDEPHAERGGGLPARSRARDPQHLDVVATREQGGWGVAYPREPLLDEVLVQIAHPSNQTSRVPHRTSRASHGYGATDLLASPGRVRPMTWANEPEEEEIEDGGWRCVLRWTTQGPGRDAPGEVGWQACRATKCKTVTGVVSGSKPSSASLGFRAGVAMLQLLVGSLCIQVGLKEEDRICQATFTSLLIVCGMMQLLQCGTAMYLIWHQIGAGGEEVRAVLFMAEVILFISVLHEVATAACENLKLELMSMLYLGSCSLTWATTGILWFAWYTYREKTHLVEEIEADTHAGDVSEEAPGEEASSEAPRTPRQRMSLVL
ncbi:hypothetical protein T484DRAFT_1964154 [Baffinella frigidus]|nr:hypothetical protein T484DRAFT_1964154 [Cryptophyta sp. CCMP2293]